MHRSSLRLHLLALTVLALALTLGLSACGDDPSTTTVQDTSADNTADITDPDVSSCGDGTMQGDEACDDGNVVDSDGCSATCTLETGFNCLGVPTVCTDIDECATSQSGCDLAADCTNTVGAFACTCRLGYVGDGKVCTPKEDCGAVACDDSNPCTDDTCDKANGCVHVNNVLACTDDSHCTEGDVCSGGACQAGATVECDDQNPCTTDSCKPDEGCTNPPNTEPCTDGDACTTGDTCALGACVPGGPTVCDDSNPCTDDACDLATGCTVTDNTVPCTDGDACTTGDLCAAGACVPGGPTVCDDSNPCTDDACDLATGCTVTDNTVPCTDGDACTTGDVCASGACVPGGPTVCDDTNPCTDDGCDLAVGCTVTNNLAPCDDNNACTTGDTCAEGECKTSTPTVCDDNNLCTTDECDPAEGCGNVLNAVPCSDGSACTVSDACAGGLCVPGAAKTCSDGNSCTDDGCDKLLGCTFTKNVAPCSDSNACTVSDACAGGLCIAGALNSCNDNNPCTTDSCDPVKGCANVANTIACDDGNACTTGDLCAAGQCKAGVGCGANASCDIAGPTGKCSCNTGYTKVGVNALGLVCAVTGSCTDGVQNGAEEAIDCGGTCKKCAGSACNGPEDCATGLCPASVCTDPVGAPPLAPVGVLDNIVRYKVDGAYANLPTTLQAAASVSFGSQTYILGGLVNGSVSKAVYTAKAGTDGLLAGVSLDATHSLVTARYGARAEVIGGYLYVFGGACSSIERAPLGSTGLAGAFQTVSQTLVTSRVHFQTVVTPKYVYVIGGNYPQSNTIERAPVDASGNLTGAFMLLTRQVVNATTVTNGLVTGRWTHGAFRLLDKVYFLGGESLASIEMTTVQADGTLGNFVLQTIQLPEPRNRLSVVALSGKIYIFGGWNQAFLKTVAVAPIVGDALGAFTNAPVTLETALEDGTPLLTNKAVYLFGGSAYGATNYIQRGLIK